MPLQDILQGDYTLSNSYFQIKLPIDLEPMIPADDWIFRRAETACPEDWKPRVRRIGNRFQQIVREALCA
jgi:hypothetical protein